MHRNPAKAARTASMTEIRSTRPKKPPSSTCLPRAPASRACPRTRICHPTTCPTWAWTRPTWPMEVMLASSVAEVTPWDNRACPNTPPTSRDHLGLELRLSPRYPACCFLENKACGDAHRNASQINKRGPDGLAFTSGVSKPVSRSLLSSFYS